ncbi:PLDc N-terminal domain-containing protein [Rhodococcus erythropolis]
MPYLGGLIIVLWIFCLIDVATADEHGVRNIPKLAWLLVVVLLPLVGSVMWLLAGRPAGGGIWGGSGTRPPHTSGRFAEYESKPGRYVAQDPDADAEFLRQCRARAEEQRRIERERRRNEGY